MHVRRKKTCWRDSKCFKIVLGKKTIMSFWNLYSPIQLLCIIIWLEAQWQFILNNYVYDMRVMDYLNQSLLWLQSYCCMLIASVVRISHDNDADDLVLILLFLFACSNAHNFIPWSYQHRCFILCCSEKYSIVFKTTLTILSYPLRTNAELQAVMMFFQYSNQQSGFSAYTLTTYTS